MKDDLLGSDNNRIPCYNRLLAYKLNNEDRKLFSYPLAAYSHLNNT
jgi:hypothetical protein